MSKQLLTIHKTKTPVKQEAGRRWNTHSRADDADAAQRPMTPAALQFSVPR